MSLTLKPEYFVQPPVELFAAVAEDYANQRITSSKNTNQLTQLRKFYAELLRWYEQVFYQDSPQRREIELHAVLPYIKMLKAKATYAQHRKHVGEDFVQMFNLCIDGIVCPISLKHAKLFMEAFIGYRKATSNQGAHAPCRD